MEQLYMLHEIVRTESSILFHVTYIHILLLTYKECRVHNQDFVKHVRLNYKFKKKLKTKPRKQV